MFALVALSLLSQPISTEDICIIENLDNVEITTLTRASESFSLLKSLGVDVKFIGTSEITKGMIVAESIEGLLLIVAEIITGWSIEMIGGWLVLQSKSMQNGFYCSRNHFRLVLQPKSLQTAYIIAEIIKDWSILAEII